MNYWVDEKFITNCNKCNLEFFLQNIIVDIVESIVNTVQIKE